MALPGVEYPRLDGCVFLTAGHHWSGVDVSPAKSPGMDSGLKRLRATAAMG
jgi:hypothetical protein